MNKISLKNHNLKEVDQLSREQLKGVLGGYTGTTGGTGTNGTDLPVGGPGCRYTCKCPDGDVSINCEGLTSVEMANECAEGC